MPPRVQQPRGQNVSRFLSFAEWLSAAQASNKIRSYVRNNLVYK